MKRRVLGMGRGSVLINLLVVIGIIALLISILMPATCASKERANRVKCASNLRQIGQALMQYANDNKGWYPRVRYAPGKPPTCFSRPATTRPFAEDGPEENDVTAAMFLLVRNCDINPEVFVCPSSNQDRDTLGGLTAAQRCNFQSEPATGNTLSYSMANMYPNTTAVDLKYVFNSGVVADFVIAADRNECRNRAAAISWDNSTTAQIKDTNALNHDSEGQNVMFNDGHVEWCTTPFVGADHDQIYTQRDAKGQSTGRVGDGQPQSQYDTVLLPYWEGGQPKPKQ